MPGKGNSYQQIISIALATLEKTGELPKTLGSLSGASYGPNPDEITRSFKTIEALRTAVIDHGTVLLADAMGRAMATADADEPKAQLLALSTAFFDWGIDNRNLFKLLATALFDPSDSEGEVLAMHRHAIRDLVERKLRESQTRGLISDKLQLSILLANTHSMVLGISSMLVLDRPDPWYKGDETDLRTLSHQLVEHYISLLFPGNDQGDG